MQTCSGSSPLGLDTITPLQLHASTPSPISITIPRTSPQVLTSQKFSTQVQPDYTLQSTTSTIFLPPLYAGSATYCIAWTPGAALTPGSALLCPCPFLTIRLNGSDLASCSCPTRTATTGPAGAMYEDWSLEGSEEFIMSDSTRISAITRVLSVAGKILIIHGEKGSKVLVLEQQYIRSWFLVTFKHYLIQFLRTTDPIPTSNPLLLNPPPYLSINSLVLAEGPDLGQRSLPSVRYPSSVSH